MVDSGSGHDALGPGRPDAAQMRDPTYVCSNYEHDGTTRFHLRMQVWSSEFVPGIQLVDVEAWTVITDTRATRTARIDGVEVYVADFSHQMPRGWSQVCVYSVATAPAFEDADLLEYEYAAAAFEWAGPPPRGATEGSIVQTSNDDESDDAGEDGVGEEIVGDDVDLDIDGETDGVGDDTDDVEVTTTEEAVVGGTGGHQAPEDFDAPDCGREDCGSVRRPTLW